MANSTQSSLVFEIGDLIVNDPSVDCQPWDAISLVATYEDGGEELVGYRYQEDGDYEAVAPQNFDEIMDKLMKLREAMSEEIEGLWVQCLLQISKPNYDFRVQYEYDDTTRWSPKNMSTSMAEYAENLRPAAK
jgi:hypothetical protein